MVIGLLSKNLSLLFINVDLAAVERYFDMDART